MHPIERLRWIARADGESAVTIAAEAAWTLGELGIEEPAAVLTASRRLVKRHPGCGPLWWACAHLLAADDPFEAARRAASSLLSDTVPDRIADALRIDFTSSDVLCATAPVDLVRQALARRSGYRLRLVAEYVWLRQGMRELGGVADDVTGYEVGDVEAALSGASVLLLEPCLASPAGLLVDPSSAAVAEWAGRVGVPIWALLGSGRVLPRGLAEAAAELAGDDLELLASSSCAVAIDDSGSGPVAAALGRPGCPASPELVRRLS